MEILFSIIIEYYPFGLPQTRTIDFFIEKNLTTQIGEFLNGKIVRGKTFSVGMEDEFDIYFGNKIVTIPGLNSATKEFRNKIFLLSLVEWIFIDYNENVEVLTPITQNLNKTFHVKPLTLLNLKTKIISVFSKYDMKPQEKDYREIRPLTKEIKSIKQIEEQTRPKSFLVLHPFRN